MHWPNMVSLKANFLVFCNRLIKFQILCSSGENRKLQVHQIFFEKGNMGKVLPEFLSKWTTERVREEGVNVIPNTEVKSVDSVDNQIKLTLNNGQTVVCDRVVLAVGSQPNTGLGQDSGLEIERKHGGYLVNAELAARNNLYVVSMSHSLFLFSRFCGGGRFTPENFENF